MFSPDRKRHKYDDLSHSQWISGVTTIAAEEADPIIQKNIFKYIATLQQDVCDNWYLAGNGFHALILSYLEERKTS